MIKTETAIALAVALGLSAGATFATDAQAAGQGAAGQPAGAAAGMHSGAAGAAEFRTRADELIDRDIVNQQGDTVGELEDVVVDKDGRLFGVVDIDGIAGLGAQDVVIPVDQLKIGQDNLTLMSQKSEDDLKKMPNYDESKYTSVRSERGTMGTDPVKTR